MYDIQESDTPSLDLGTADCPPLDTVAQESVFEERYGGSADTLEPAMDALRRPEQPETD